MHRFPFQLSLEALKGCYMPQRSSLLMAMTPRPLIGILTGEVELRSLAAFFVEKGIRSMNFDPCKELGDGGFGTVYYESHLE
ncbi:hypothetical protein ACS0TY_026445 [Phlomoides rotata]